MMKTNTLEYVEDGLGCVIIMHRSCVSDQAGP